MAAGAFSDGTVHDVPIDGDVTAKMELSPGQIDAELHREKRKTSLLIIFGSASVVLLSLAVFGLTVAVQKAGAGSDGMGGEPISVVTAPPQTLTAFPTPPPSPNTGAVTSTPAPTVSIEVARQSVRSFLQDNDISTVQSLGDQNSPQARAVEYLLSDASTVYLLPPDTNTATGQRLLEKYALTVLFYSMNGPGWDYPHRFTVPSIDHCDWFTNVDIPDPSNIGTISTTMERRGVLCNNNDKVSGLRIGQ